MHKGNGIQAGGPLTAARREGRWGDPRLRLEDSLPNPGNEHFHEVVHNELCLDKLQPRFGDELLGAAVEAGAVGSRNPRLPQTSDSAPQRPLGAHIIEKTNTPRPSLRPGPARAAPAAAAYPEAH